MLNNQCEVCGLVRDETDHFIPSVGKPLTPETAYAKVCQFAKESGCINNVSNPDPSQGYQFPPGGLQLDHDKMAKEILREFRHDTD
jgi:hypothetical protein